MEDVSVKLVAGHAKKIFQRMSEMFRTKINTNVRIHFLKAYTVYGAYHCMDVKHGQ